jgi:hypothetical protein
MRISPRRKLSIGRHKAVQRPAYDGQGPHFFETFLPKVTSSPDAADRVRTAVLCEKAKK